ncbi:MAG TPA: 50S ribosomal protein L6 [Candidatus Saccharimonadales bacterium]
MSRIGKQLIKIPTGVTVTVDDKNIIVTGPKGTLEQFLIHGINFEQVDDVLNVTRIDDEATSKANHGLIRSLVNNMVIGVTAGFERKLELNGVGYKVVNSADGLKLNLGFSHDVNYKLPEGVTASIDGNIIVVKGISKQAVGQAAAEIRSLKKPEPYKGKGIKYVEERIIRKSGKSGKEK